MSTCPACGSEANPRDSFCSTCGAVLAAPCSSCGADLRPGADFCAACGTPVRRTAAAVEHRLVTALYVDLVGSTGLAEQLDPENLAALVGEVHGAVRAEVADHGGSVGAFVGDGVLGVFGLPVAHDDDPDRALRAAAAILERVAALDRTLGERLEVAIETRIGVNTGELMAPIGDDPDLGTLAGDVLNVAARLQEFAHPGTIVATERTARSANHFRFEDLGLVDLRGRARPIHAFAVTGESALVVRPSRAPLTGRTNEQSVLQDVYRRVVAAGSPHLLTIVGNAGVGKSRLVNEFVEWAERTDPTLTTLVGRCLPYGEDITYRPLAEVLADLTGVTAVSDPVKAAEKVRALIDPWITASDVPDAADALLRMVGLEPPHDRPPAPRRVRELLRSTWRSLLTGLAADGPVILLVEDIHWAGDTLLDLLSHVVGRGEGPLLVVTPARPELVERSPEWTRPEKRSSTLALETLGPEDASRLAVRLLADAGLAVALADEITGRADGNPFFIEELVKELALRRDDTGHDHEFDLPATIQGVVSARIDLLESRERRALQAASVVGRIFWPSAVAHMTGLSRDAVAEALQRLEALQLIRVNLRAGATDEIEYLFQHVLIREAAYGRLSRPDLARLHAAIAEWLEARAADRPEAWERLAYHTFRAHEAATGASGFPEPELARLRGLALDRLITSASRSRDRAAFGRSKEIASAALRIAAGPVETARAQEQLGLTYLAEYDGDSAWDALRAAVDLHLQAPEVDKEAVARLAGRAVETPLRWQGTMRQLPPMADILRYIDVGIEHAGSEDSEYLAELLTALSFAPITPGPQGMAAREVISVDDAAEAGRRARQMARRLGLAHVESAALDALQNHALWGGRIQEAANLITERLEIVDTVNDPWELGDTYAMASWLSFDLGNYALARDRALHGYKRTIDEAPSTALHTLTWATVARVQTGEWDEVASALGRAHELLDPERHNDPPLYASPLYAAAAMVAEFRGRSTEADRLLAILTDVWAASDWAARGGHPHARWSRHSGPIYIRRGDFDTAARMVLSDDAERIGREGDRLAVLCELVGARRAWVEADGAIAEARAAAAAYGLQAISAHADRLEGLTSAAGGDRRGGLALLRAARERFEALGDHWEAARTGLHIGEAGGEIDAAYLNRFFKSLGAEAEVRRASALGGDPP